MKKLYTLADVVIHPLGTAHNFRDRTGQVFERLTVLGYAGKKGNGLKPFVFWWCKCECGSIVQISGTALGSDTKSCGCLQRQLSAVRHTIHGQSRNGAHTPEYQAFKAAKGRIKNPKHKNASRYQTRGLTFEFESFEQWLAELGPRPSPEMSVERIDNNLGYVPGNVKWGTKTEQTVNRDMTVFIEVNGLRLHQSEWARRTGISPVTICNRISRGWPPELAATLPKNSKKPT